MSEDPIALFLADRARAHSAGNLHEGTAAALATATRDGVPAARYVLVKDVGPDGFYFFTNYESRKASELDQNPRVTLCFHWPEIGVQYRIDGTSERASEAKNDAYFASRPRESQLGAWASPQSKPIDSREALLARFEEVKARYAGGTVPRPPHWGGYRIVAQRVERWVAADHRLHDRFLYERHGKGWRMTRLAP